MDSDKFVVSFECNKTAKDNIVPLLKYFEMLGLLGGTRDFKVDDKWFTFDGDGPDRLTNISTKKLEL